MPIAGIVTPSQPQLVEVLRAAGWKVVAYDQEPLKTSVYLAAQETELLISEYDDDASVQRTMDLLMCKDVPWLALVSAGTMADRAVEMAAGDVIFSPANPHEVAWRARRVLTRAQHQLRIGSLSIDLTARVVWLDDHMVTLTASEFRLLAYFARRCGHTISCEEILAQVWGCSSEFGGTRDQVKCAIKRLRQKIEPNPKKPEYLVSMKDSGYLLRNSAQWGAATLTECLKTNTDLTPQNLLFPGINPYNNGEFEKTLPKPFSTAG